MAIENIPEALLTKLGDIGLWLQAIGLIIVIWLIFQMVNWFINRKRLREVYKIKDDMKRIERKIDKILQNQRRK